ncbi:MAG: hypothetical protein RQ750_13900 [Roseovarius sp.]|nr:hypothetical protein [Roseovarius sp.]
MTSRSPTTGEQLVAMRKDMERIADAFERLERAHITEVAAIRDEVKLLTEAHTETKTRVDKVLGNVRAFGAGMAAAFTLIGGGIATAVAQLLGWFK